MSEDIDKDDAAAAFNLDVLETIKDENECIGAMEDAND